MASTCIALALALGLPEHGIDSKSLPHTVAISLGTGCAALVFGMSRLANGAFCLAGLAAYVIMQSTSVAPEDGRPLGSFAGGSLEIEQYSTANLESLDGNVPAVLTGSHADVIAVQGLTPDWARVLAEGLLGAYPSQYLFPDIGVAGLGVFSRRPLEEVDTMLIEGLVQLRACHLLPGSDVAVEIFAVQTLPPLSRESSLGLQAQLDEVSRALAAERRPVILVGDLNAVPWSPIVNRFAARAGLRDSRRNELPNHEGGMPGLFETPVEHIFYNDGLRCVRFETVRSQSAAYLGNRASFQFADAATEMVAL